MKRKLLTLMLVVMSTTIFGQTYDFSKITINGLELHEKYSEEELFSALGSTTNIAKTGVLSYVEYTFPNDDVIGMQASYFRLFSLSSINYALNDYLRLGDNISKLYEMGGTVSTDPSSKLIKYWRPQSDDPKYSDVSVMIRIDDSNMINEISCIAVVGIGAK